MSHGYLKSWLLTGCALLAIIGCKKKEAPAVIEEVPPPTVAPAETDTSATLAEEPALKQVGKKNDKAGAKATFHPSAAAGKAGISDVGHFVVQVSVFKNKKQAAHLVEKLAGAGFPAYVAEVENPTSALSGTYHRVRIGKFSKVKEARAFGEDKLKPLGYDFWVDNQKNDAMGGDGSAAEPKAEATPAPAKHAPKAKKSKAAANTAPAGGAPAPASSGSFSTSTPAEPSAPSEPAAPSSESWGNPKSEPAPPASESWGTPKESDPSSVPAPTGPAASTSPATPAASPASKSSAAKAKSPASESPKSAGASGTQKAPGDSGKVNLDDW